MKRFMGAILAIVLPLALITGRVLAYPETTKATLSLGFGSTVTGLAITDNNDELFVSYSDVLALTDLGLWDLAADQPPALSSDDDDEGNIQGLAYNPSSSYLYAAQDNGHVLTYSINSITSNPTVNKLLEGVKLGPIAIDTISSPHVLYMVDNANSKVQIWQVGSDTISGVVDLKQAPDLSNVATAFNVLDILFAPDTKEVYVATDIGIVAYFSTSNTGNPNDFVLDSTKAADIAALAITPNGSKLYASTGTQLPPDPDSYPTIYVVSTSSHTQVSTPMTLENSENSAFVSMRTMEVIDPTGAVYGFVSGSKGVTVFNTSNDQFIDVGGGSDLNTYAPIPTSNTSGPLITSGDNYIYLAGSGNLLVITDNPWIDISDIVYKDSTGAVTTALKIGGSCELTFQSDIDGEYLVMVGGGVDRSGENVIDVNGSSTGSVTAATDTTFIFNYDDNSSNFDEGDNTVYVFVTASSSSNLKGRSATDVVVDTPPGAITIDSTGFGDERAYITFDRLTASDISHYDLYSDTDPVAVRTKTDASARTAQADSGSTITGHIDDLTNGTTYYLAIEGVDNAGNVGPRAYLKSDGTAASALPQTTVGPAGMSGEKGGCSVSGSGKVGDLFCILMALAALVVMKCSRSFRGRRITVLIFVLLSSFFAFHAFAEEASETPRSLKRPMWSAEIKAGFWMPTGNTTKKFFDKCCNIVTMIDGGFLYEGRYGVEAGIGFMVKDRPALGATTGEVSSDTFNMFLLPMETNAVWRIDYIDRQPVVPYIKGGVDYVFYREGDRDGTIKGLKTGLHAIGGIQFMIPGVELDNEDYGISGMYILAEARYGWVNSFGAKGLDLSGLTYSAGFLFEF